MHTTLKPYLEKGKLYLTLTEAQRAISVTPPTWHKLRALGLAPHETRLAGTNVIRISIEDLDRWMTERENPGKAERIGIAQQKARLKLSSALAVANQKYGDRRARHTEAAE